MDRRRTVLIICVSLVTLCAVCGYFVVSNIIANSIYHCHVGVTCRAARKQILTTLEHIPATRQLNTSTLPSAVVLLLVGGMNNGYFLKVMLPHLNENFLLCHPYPVHIFHENMTMRLRQRILERLPFANGITLENVFQLWEGVPDHYPRCLPLKNSGTCLGYRLMCRFWAGVVWDFPSLDKYEFYLRLDTDSVIPRPVLWDPFVLMKAQKCDYAYNYFMAEHPTKLVDGLWETYLRWAESEGVQESRVSYVRSVVTNSTTSEYFGGLFFNNFEMATFRVKRHELYRSLFRYIDTTPPFGIVQLRWGDAPVHTLGVLTVLTGSNICRYDTKELFPYIHDCQEKDRTELKQLSGANQCSLPCWMSFSR